MPIKVAAGSRTSGLRGTQDGSLKISVTVAPEKDKANKAVIKLLADHLGIPKASMEIVAGATSPQKQILCSGISLTALESRIAKSVQGKSPAK